VLPDFFWYYVFSNIFIPLCCCLTWLEARCPQKPLYHSCFSAGQGRENMMKGSWIKIRTQRDHSAITIMGKADSMSGNQFDNLSTIKGEQDNEE